MTPTGPPFSSRKNLGPRGPKNMNSGYKKRGEIRVIDFPFGRRAKHS